MFILIFAITAGCTAARMQFNQRSLHQLHGQEERAVIKMLGTPQRVETAGSKRYLIYTTHYENYTPAVSGAYMSPGTDISATQGTYESASCTTIFTIEEKQVTNVQTTGACL